MEKVERSYFVVSDYPSLSTSPCQEPVMVETGFVEVTIVPTVLQEVEWGLMSRGLITPFQLDGLYSSPEIGLPYEEEDLVPDQYL